MPTLPMAISQISTNPEREPWLPTAEPEPEGEPEAEPEPNASPEPASDPNETDPGLPPELNPDLRH